MDSSFTFVTAITPAKSRIKGAPKFSKYSNENVTESNLKSKKNAVDLWKPSTSKVLLKDDHLINVSSSPHDSIPSLKSRSDSLHLSSDRSISDHGNQMNHSHSKKSYDQSSLQKIMQEVHTGLERITFRKKRNVKTRTEDCAQINSSKNDNSNVKSSTPTSICDKLKDSKSNCTEDLNVKMRHLNLEKFENTRLKENKSTHKKLFNGVSDFRNEPKNIQICDNPVNVPIMHDALFSSDSSGIISEDISPILRLSVAPLTNVYLHSDEYLSPANTSKQDTKEINNAIEISDKLESKEISKNVKSTVQVKDNKRRGAKVLSELRNFENNIEKNEEAEDTGKIKQKVTKPKPKKTKKKKDSFIVSDTSSIADESMSVYHKFISQNIRFDVIKTTTPRSKLKHNPEFHDDGIFTPFILGKRSSSDDSESEKENDYKSDRLKKSRISSSDEDIHTNLRRNLILSSSENSKKSVLSEISDTEKKIRPKKKLQGKKISRLNISSDSFKSSTESFKSEIDKESDSSPSFTPSSSGNNGKKKITPITFKLKNLKKLTPARTPTTIKKPYSFLRSLSTLTSPHMVHPEAQQYRKSFKKLKQELATKLFVLFNKEVFENKLPDDMKIEWNPRMRSSSGLCYNKRIKTIIGPNNECLRVSRIALSTKIIETPERLRDTLIHELCHAAAWIIDNKADGHGPCWKSWVVKAQRRFPELPPIRRCHDYSIQTKFKYRCVNCGYTIGRHSKSLNLERKRCGYCYSRFELILNKELVDSAASNLSPKNVKARPLSKFALFVKDNYGKIKSDNTNMKHGDIMRMLSKNFAETKA